MQATFIYVKDCLSSACLFSHHHFYSVYNAKRLRSKTTINRRVGVKQSLIQLSTATDFLMKCLFVSYSSSFISSFIPSCQCLFKPQVTLDMYLKCQLFELYPPSINIGA